MDIRQKGLTGEAIQWTGGNSEDVERFTGDSFRGYAGLHVKVLAGAGEIVHVQHGWWITRWPGAGLIVSTGHAFDALCEVVS